MEHLQAAEILWDRQRYGAAQYLAGLAVECMLMAYSHRAGAEFDTRHDLRNWYAKARFRELMPSGRKDETDAAIGILILHWKNDQRYYSERLLAAHFRKLGLDRYRDARGSRRVIKGNLVKELTRQTIDSALVIVTIGEIRWQKSLQISS